MGHFTDLLESAQSAKHEVVLVAPFVKEEVVRNLLAMVEPGASVLLVTRWRPDEILAGVSDVGVHRVISKRRDRGFPSEFRLLDSVHAKYYRFDDATFIGSANLTATGLGVVGDAVEILLKVDYSPVLAGFEDYVVTRSVQPSIEVIEAFENLELQTLSTQKTVKTVRVNYFFPLFRDPADLWRAVTDDDYPSSFRDAALADARALHVPHGIAADQFHASIVAAFGASQIVCEMRAFVSQPRRFGEVRSWVSERIPTAMSTTTGAQTLLRWLTEFLPNEFSVRTANYSEVLTRSYEG